MKLKSLLLLFFSPIIFLAQTNAKVNLLTALFAVPQLGIETKLGSKTTFQLDLEAAFWKSFSGGPQQFLIVIPEFRYYPKAAFDGVFIGGHIGGSIYRLQKWNYINTDKYQEGYSYLIGVTIGYQFRISDQFAGEMFAGGGNQQAFYKGYLLSNGTRYDGSENYNKSGEFLPYRIGMMFIYKLK